MGAKKRKPAYVVTAPEELVAGTKSKRESAKKKQPGRLTIVGVIWLTAMLVVAPWLFGSVAPLFVFGLLTGFAVLLSIWWYCVVLQGERAIRQPWNLVPLLLGIGLAIGQLVPLPEGMLKALAPEQYELRERLGWLPQAPAPEQTSDTASNAVDGATLVAYRSQEAQDSQESQESNPPTQDNEADQSADRNDSSSDTDQSDTDREGSDPIVPGETSSADEAANSETANSETTISELAESVVALPNPTDFPKSILDPAQNQRGGFPLSLNPSGTRRDLTLLLLATAAFACGAAFLRRRQVLLAFAMTVAINGVLLSMFGIIQRATWNGNFFWFIPHTMGEPFASFVNANNAGGYLNLCFAAALCAVMIAFRATKREREEIRKRESAGLQLPDERPAAVKALLGIVSKLTIWRLAILFGAAIIAAGVFFSLSRGAIIASSAAAMVTFGILLLTDRYRMVGLAIFGLFGAALGLTFILGDLGIVKDEMATVEAIDYENDDRVQLATDVLPAWQSHWRVGSGLGSFRHIYRSYRPNTHDSWFYHADNQYLEAMIDGGIPALVLIVICVVWSFAQAVYLVRYAETSTDTAVGMMASFALVSQVVQAALDYGLYIPANMLLLAVICGASAIQAHRLAASRRSAAVSAASRSSGQSNNRTGRASIPAMPTFVAWLVPIALFGGLVWAGKSAYTDIELTAASKQAAELVSLGADADEADVEDAILRLANIVEHSDQEIGYRRLGDLYVLRYRLAQTDFRLEYDRLLAAEADRPQVFALTDLLILHGTVRSRVQELGEAGLSGPRSDARVKSSLIAALEAFRNARLKCPLVPTNHLRLAQLSFIYESPDLNGVHLARAAYMAPGRADILFQVGWMHSQASRKRQATTYWQKSAKVSPEFHEAILIHAAALFSSGEIARDVVPDSLPVLLPLIARIRASSHFSNPRHEVIVALENRALELYASTMELDPSAVSADDSVGIAQIYLVREQSDEAIQVLGAATKHYPEYPEPHYHLARTYFTQSEFENARKALKDCLFLRPKEERYQRLERQIGEEERKKEQTDRSGSVNSANSTGNDPGFGNETAPVVDKPSMTQREFTMTDLPEGFETLKFETLKFETRNRLALTLT